MKKHWRKLVGGMALFAVPALAQPRTVITESREVGEYAGVAPDNQNTPPGHETVRQLADRRLVTWPGFQMLPNGGSRFFLQLTQVPQTELVPSEGRLELILKETITHVRNTRRPLETRFFNTPVLRAQVERRENDLVFVFHLRVAATPEVRTRPGANGYQFLTVDFPPGQYVDGPAPVPPPAPPRDEGSSLVPDEEPPFPQPRDTERPPGM